ncbi:hypothetical protein IMSHALPRED_006410 [Imshaugia aleurites]|uniref:Rhodopsin domain-containing protein n=1 Tax=Imshaugia aleurites TaxID=172621 RepID=A0A8H3IRZ3_9LECA|nr:hypothetical protein IMSHALPRED_006410 [Imshaugia aleurites]
MHQRRHSLDERAPLGVATIAINTVFVVLAALALGIRLMSRRFQGLGLSFNDYAALLAWPLAVAIDVTNFFMAFQGGAGQHLANVDSTEITVTLKKSDVPQIIPAETCLWATANALVKLSILHFYLTIFGTRKPFRYATYAVMALVLSFGIGLNLQAFLICRPFAKNWNRLLPGTCGPVTAPFLADSSINILMDLAIVVLPMPVVWQLQMVQKRKIALTIVFALGVLVCVVALIRVVLIARLNIDDYLYDFTKITIVTDLEICLGIIVACMPMFPPTLKRMLRGKKDPSLFRRHMSSGVALMRPKNPHMPAFHRIDDLYPLTDLDEMRTWNEICGTDGKPDSLVDDPDSDAKLEMHPRSTIKIKKGWEVRSGEAV